jgi:hypothetical protein
VLKTTWIVCALAVLIHVTGLSAAESALWSEPVDAELAARDSTLGRYDGRTIDSLVVDSRNIFDTDDPQYAGFLFRTANRLHIVTREHVIRRELLFAPGDRFSSELARETARNLRSDYSIYDAWWEIEELDSGGLLVRLVTTDRWSLTGGVVLQRNGDETDFQIGFEEDNFLGLNQYLLLQYEMQEADENFAEARFQDRRVFGHPFLLGLRYKGDPTDEIKELTVGRPFYNLQQRFSFGASVLARGARRDLYDDNNSLLARSTSAADQFLLEGIYRWGSYKNKTGLMLNYRYVFETTFDRKIAEGVDPGDIVFPTDSVAHEIVGGAFLQNLEFATTRRLNGFDQVEDVTLGQSLTLRAGRAFVPGLNDYRYDLLTFEARLAGRFRHNLLIINYDRTFWFRRESDLRRWSQVSVVYYNNRLPIVTFAARVLYQRDWRSDNSARLELGGASGLRGFPRRFRIGDRMVVANLETRWFPGLELLSVQFGGVLFTDLARSWKPDEATLIEDFHQTIGVGLRISLEKASNAELFRIDLSRNQDNQWEVSFGTGQYF